MTTVISIELVFAAPDSQILRQMTLPEPATVASAIAASGIAKEFPGYGVSELPTGIWGRLVCADEKLKDGDRVEIYRQLLMDPMAARRLRASEPDPDPGESR